MPGGATVQYKATMKSFVKEKETWDLGSDAAKARCIATAATVS